MFKITKRKPGQKAYSDYSTGTGSQAASRENQESDSGGFRIYKIQQAAKPAAPASNPTGRTAAQIAGALPLYTRAGAGPWGA